MMLSWIGTEWERLCVVRTLLTVQSSANVYLSDLLLLEITCQSDDNTTMSTSWLTYRIFLTNKCI